MNWEENKLQFYLLERLEEMILRKNKFNSFIAGILCSVITLSPGISAIAADMPIGGSVQNGSVQIASINPNHMVINQSSHNSVIHWDSFSIHSKELLISICHHQVLRHLIGY